MRFVVLIFVMMLSVLLPVQASVIKSEEVAFGIEDFELTVMEDSSVSIHSDKYRLTFDGVRGTYALPYVPIEIEIPEGFLYSRHRESINQKIAGENVKLQKIKLYEVDAEGEPTPLYSDDVLIEEIETVQFLDIHKNGDRTFARFLVSPFNYNSENGELFINESISLEIDLENDNGLMRASNHAAGIAKYGNLVSSGGYYSVDYLIFTNRELYPAFKRLADWKTSRGVSTFVLPIEDNFVWDASYDTVQNMKYTIYAFASDFGTKHVMLGGNEEAIPVVYCHGSVANEKAEIFESNKIPSDLFYVCPFGDFDWDANRNGIKGEIFDNVNLSRCATISRVSVSSIESANSFVTKIIDYESHPEKFWTNKMLRAACVLFQSSADNDESFDYRKESRNIANNCIKPFWNGMIDELYSFYPDTNIGGLDLSKETLSSVLEDGYSYVDFNGENGSRVFWFTRPGEFYVSLDAKSQVNKGYSIITSSGQQNAFDRYLSVSEGFLEGAKNGVLAFWGSSLWSGALKSSNFLADASCLGTYIGSFYRMLFESNHDMIAIGDVAGKVKDHFMEFYGSDAYRWLQYSVNLLGDAEMPLYVNRPLYFEDVKISYRDGDLEVNTGDVLCDISIAQEYLADDIRNGALELISKKCNCNIASFNGLTGKGVLSITKNGFVPLIIPFDSGKLFIQNQTLSGNHQYLADEIYIGSQYSKLKQCGKVELCKGSISLQARDVVIDSQTEIQSGANLNILNTVSE